jgi:HEAT repeat protein
LGQVKVLVQTFRGVPIQVKTSDGRAEKRVALLARFVDAAKQIQTATGANYLKDRYWAEHGHRYGTVDEVAAQVAEEIEAVKDAAALAHVVAAAAGPVEVSGLENPAARAERAKSDLASDDWHRRYRALQELGANEEVIDHLALALKDPEVQVRRFAAALLGGTGSPKAVPTLCEALSDPSVGVRRTAGDSLSDIGDPAAQESMCGALSDASKLVRWRAARYLAEVGTELALPHLADHTAVERSIGQRLHLM